MSKAYLMGTFKVKDDMLDLINVFICTDTCLTECKEFSHITLLEGPDGDFDDSKNWILDFVEAMHHSNFWRFVESRM